MWPHRGSAPYYNHSGRGLSDIRGGQWKINNDINKDEWEQLIGQFSCTAAGSFKHRTTITFFILEPQTISLNVSLNWRTRTTSVNADELVKTQWNCPQNSKELLRNFTMIYILTLELSLNWNLDLDTELLEHRQDPSLKLFGVFALKPLENWRAEAGRTCGTSWMNRIPQQNIWSTPVCPRPRLQLTAASCVLIGQPFEEQEVDFWKWNRLMRCWKRRLT